MVYRRGTLKVMLGPENMQGDGELDGTDSPDSHVVQLKPQSRKQPEPPHAYGKIGETNVYKRTRPYQPVQPRPKLDRYPSGLELSGQKVDKDDNKAKSAKSVRPTLSSRSVTRVKEPDSQPEVPKSEEPDDKAQTGKDADMTAKCTDGAVKSAQKHRIPRHSANNFVSQYFLTDFGLRAERTDTFSGHHRRRGVASADIERQMEEKAEKHIRTCQLMGNVRRGCKAQLGYQGLRHAVSPRHVPGGGVSPDPSRSTGLHHKDLYRSEENLIKTNSVPYMIQLRKSLGSISKTRAIGQAYQRPDPLPAITCRTLMVGSGLGV